MNTHTPITLDTQPVLSWKAPVHPTVIRTKRWYVIAVVIVCTVALYGIVSGAWSLAIVSILAGGMYILVRDHKPPLRTIDLHQSGILFGGTFRRWDEFAGYWLLPTPTYTELHLTPLTGGRDIVIQTGEQNIAQLRMILGQRIPELTQKRESLIDTIIRFCKL